MPNPQEPTSYRKMLAGPRQLQFGVQLTGLVLLTALVPLAIYLSVVLLFETRSLVDLNSRRLQIQSGQTAQDRDRFISQNIRATRARSQAEVLERDDSISIEQYLREIRNTDEEIKGILMLDMDGKPAGTVGDYSSAVVDLLLQNESADSLIHECVSASQGQVFVSEAMMTESGPAIVLVTPITDDNNLDVIKVLLVEYSLTRPQNLVNACADSFSGDALVYILNSSNQTICSSDGSVGFLQPFPDLADQPDLVRLLDEPGRSGEFKFRDRRGRDLAAGYGNMAKSGNDQSLAWRLVAVATVDAIAHPVMETNYRLGVTCFAVAFLSVVFALILARRITRPLKEVVLAVRRVSQGDINTKLQRDQVQEIGEISTAINSMSEAIESQKRELMESEQRFRSLVELLPIGVQRCDLKGKITFANPAHAAIYGISVDELQEKNIWGFEIDEASRVDLRDCFLSVIKEQPEPTVYFARNRTSDGRIINIQANWTCERDSSGMLTSMITVISDITNSLRIEREVRAVNEELQLAHRQAKLGSWKLNIDTGTGYWSPELFRIFERDEALGPPDFDEFIERIYPEDRQLVLESHEQMINNQLSPRVQFRIISRDGSVRFLQGICCGDILTDTAVQSFPSGTLQGITELKLAEQSLRASEEQLRLLNSELEKRVVERKLEPGAANEDLEACAHSVAHDLRAPLRAIFGFSQALREDCADKPGETGREHTGFIEQASQQMDELISDLLEYSKTGRCTVSKEILDLNEVVLNALFQLSAQISQRYAEISVQPSMGSIVGYRSTITQVVISLVSNAIKFVGDGVTPQIRIGSDQNSQSVRLWVEDNGIGIKPEFQKRVFKVFERLHGMETFSGTGIGLAIVRWAVESMGGQVGFDAAPDHGSRFWVEFPNDLPEFSTSQFPALALVND